MRIALVCPYSLSIPGGVQNQVLSMGRAMRDLGHETRVLAPCDGPPPDPMVTPLGRSIPTAINGSIAPVAPDPAAALRTIAALRNEQFDVVHLHEPLAPGASMTALVTSDAPIVGTFHAAGVKKQTAYTWTPWLLRRMAKRLDVRVAVSVDAKATAERTLGGEYQILYNGIETERFAPTEPKPSEKSIFFLGRHEQRKGLSVLIEAMAHVPSDVKLLIAGTGPQTEQLTKQTAGNERIVWLGRVSDTERTRYLQAATVFCAPSLEGESFGIVLLEAMAAQTPVVASDLPGYRNVASDGHDARLVSPNDAVALGLALNQVLDDKDLQNALVVSGIERAEHFSMKQLALTYVAIYEAIR